MNNLWNYLQGLSLTADNWQWLAERAKEKSNPFCASHLSTQGGKV